jgi:hypothetical protein
MIPENELGTFKKSYQDREWLEEQYWGRGLNTRQIGELVGFSRKTITYWMNKHGIPRRESSEWQRKGEDSPHWRGGKVKRECEWCGAKFEIPPCWTKKGHGRFCSQGCANEFQRSENNPNRRRIKRMCEGCGTEFEIQPANPKRFCSRSCFAKTRKGKDNPNWCGGDVELVCKQCEKIFRVNPHAQFKRLFCSQRCSGNWQRETEIHKGEGNPAWLGGFSFEPYGLEFNDDLKRAIRARDGFTCQLCGIPENGQVHDCHHVDYCKANNDPQNLITLCRPCHMKTNYQREYWQYRLEMFME